MGSLYSIYLSYTLKYKYNKPYGLHRQCAGINNKCDNTFCNNLTQNDCGICVYCKQPNDCNGWHMPNNI